MFYNIYKNLCKEKNISLSKAAEENRLSRTSVVKWKNGSVPSGATLQKLAIYFGVTADYLLGKETQEKTLLTPAKSVSDDDIKFALFNGHEGITDEMYDEVKSFAEFVKQKHKKENNV